MRTRVPMQAGSLLAGLLLALLLIGAAPTASADGEAPLGRLTPEERAVLERRIPGLGSLPAEKQQQIVRNVERLRGLDPAQRALVEKRLRAAREAGLAPRDLAEREQAWRGLGDRRVQAEWQMRMVKALGWRAWHDLPAALRQHPAVEPLQHREWPQAFHQRFLKKAAQILDDDQVRGWEPPASLPEAWRNEFAKDRERLLTAPDPVKGLAELRKRVLLGRALVVVQEGLQAPTTGEDAPAARLAVLGERLKQLSEPAYTEALAEMQRLAEAKGPEAFAEQLREMVRPPKPAPEVQRRIEAYQVVLALEACAPLLLRRPELVGPADALLRAALVDELGMPAATFDALPARKDGQEARTQALRAWADEALPRDLRRHLFQRRFGGERPGGAPVGAGPWRRGPGGIERGPEKR